MGIINYFRLFWIEWEFIYVEYDVNVSGYSVCDVLGWGLKMGK